MLNAVTEAAKQSTTTASFFLSQNHREDKQKRGSDNWSKQKVRRGEKRRSTSAKKTCTKSRMATLPNHICHEALKIFILSKILRYCCYRYIRYFSDGSWNERRDRKGHERVKTWVRKNVQTEEAALLGETSYWRRLVWNRGENISPLYVWPGRVKDETKSDRERHTDNEVSLPLLRTQTVTDRIHAAHFSGAFSALGSFEY